MIFGLRIWNVKNCQPLSGGDLNYQFDAKLAGLAKILVQYNCTLHLLASESRKFRHFVTNQDNFIECLKAIVFWIDHRSGSDRVDGN